MATNIRNIRYITYIAVSSALAMAAAAPAHAAQSAASALNPNPGDAAPSLALSVTPSGTPDVASVGKDGSLWFATHTAGTWLRTRIAGPGSATSGPSLVAEGDGSVILAVQGPSHSLQYYFRTGGHWHHTQVAGKNTTYSAPSLAQGPSEPGIAAQGPGHSLMYYALTTGHWRASTINGPSIAYSVPSLVIRLTNQASAGHPAGEVDIAVQNAGHSLSYYNSLPHGHWQNDVIGTVGTTYSAPSLIVINTAFGHPTDVGIQLIAVEGAKHSLLYYQEIAGSWKSTLREGKGWVYSAPSLFQGDSDTELPVAFQGASHTLELLYFNVLGRAWQNDLVAKISSAFSAPALFFRPKNPVGELDIAVQGQSNRLRYYSAPPPPSGFAASFIAATIAGKGTTFGG